MHGKYTEDLTGKSTQTNHQHLASALRSPLLSKGSSGQVAVDSNQMSEAVTALLFPVPVTDVADHKAAVPDAALDH